MWSPFVPYKRVMVTKFVFSCFSFAADPPKSKAWVAWHGWWIEYTFQGAAGQSLELDFEGHVRSWYYTNDREWLPGAQNTDFETKVYAFHSLLHEKPFDHSKMKALTWEVSGNMISGHMVLIVLVADTLQGKWGTHSIYTVSTHKWTSFLGAVEVPEVPTKLSWRFENWRVFTLTHSASFPLHNVRLSSRIVGRHGVVHRHTG